MADDDVTQKFTADAERYIGPVAEMKAATDGLRDALLEAVHEIHGLRDGLAEVAGATDGNTMAMAELRDKLAEVAVAADGAKHEMSGLRDAEAEAAAAGSAEGGGGFLSGLLSSLGEVSPVAAVLVTVLVPAIAAALVEVAGLAAGFTAAGLGLGAFALLASRAFGQIKNGYTAVSTAQGAYQKALATEKDDPTKANAAAVTSALDKLKVAWSMLSPAARQGVHGIDQLKASYDQMAKAFTPDAMKVFDDGLKIANELLPQVKPFADTAATALDRMLKGLAGFFAPAARAVPVTENLATAAQRLGINVKGQLTPWQQFLSYMHGLEGPALRAIGSGLGNVGTSLLQLLQVMSKKDVVNSINIAFRLLSGTIRILTGVIRFIMGYWDLWTSIILRSAADVEHWSRDVRRDFDDVIRAVELVSTGMGRLGDVISAAMAAAGKAVLRFAEDMYRDVTAWISRTVSEVESRWDSGWGRVTSVARSVPGKITGALGNLGGLLVSAGASLIRGLISGIEGAIPGLESAISFVRGLVSSIEGLVGRVTGAAASAGSGGGGAHAAIAGLAGGPRPALAGAGPAGPQQVHVTVSLANVMSTPRAQQALAAHVQEAIGDFASRAAGSFLVLPGKGPGR